MATDVPNVGTPDCDTICSVHVVPSVCAGSAARADAPATIPNSVVASGAMRDDEMIGIKGSNVNLLSN
ncbi:MAG TPA: hypothetical protein VGC30_12990 [Dokdonella sp.]